MVVVLISRDAGEEKPKLREVMKGAGGGGGGGRWRWGRACVAGKENSADTLMAEKQTRVLKRSFKDTADGGPCNSGLPED